MPAPEWQFGLTDLAGVRIGPLEGARDRRLHPVHAGNGQETASCRLRLDDPTAHELIARKGDCLVKAYQSSALRFVGDVVTIEVVGRGYRWMIDRSGLCNQAYVLGPSAAGDLVDVRSAINQESVTARGLYQEVIPNDLTDPQLRQALAEAHVRVRGVAREEFSIAPSDAEPSVAVTAMGPLWRLHKRLTAIDPAGAPTSYSNTAAQEIIRLQLAAVNAAGNTRVRWDATPDTLYNMSTGGWSYKPLGELLTEMWDAKVPFPFESPPSSLRWAYDSFNSGSGGVNGRTDEKGNTWSTNGSAPDWTVGSGTASRVAAAASTGRNMVNSAAPVAGQLVSAVFRCSVPSSTGYADFLYAQLWARFNAHPTDTDPQIQRGLVLTIDYSDPTASGGARCTLQKQKAVGGVTEITSLGSWQPGGLDTTFYKAYVIVDSYGNYSAGLQHVGDAFPGWGVTGNDPDLATGGALGAGGLCWRDAAGAGAGGTAWYVDEIGGFNYTGPAAGFDFRLAPLDIGVGGETNLAELQVRNQIGALKPNAIFEFGTGDGRDQRPDYGTDYTVGDYVPVQVKTDLTIPAPPLAEDRFDQSVTGGADPLDGLTLPVGGTWDTSPSAGTFDPVDFEVEDTGHTVRRTETQDTWFQGRWAAAGPTMTNTFVSIDCRRSAATGSPGLDQGVFARFTDANNWIMAYVEYISSAWSDPYLVIRKRVAGTMQALALVPGASLINVVDNAWYTLAIEITALGGIAVYFYPQGETPNQVLTASLSAGELTSGKGGFYDCCFGTIGPPACTRHYDNYLVNSGSTALFGPAQARAWAADISIDEEGKADTEPKLRQES